MRIKSTLLACLFTLLLGAFLSGCTTASKLNDVHIGMTKDQVLAIMGKPDSMSAQSNVEYFTYYLTNDRDYRDQPYMVRMVDGKVESFGRFTQLFDLYNRPVTGLSAGDPNFPQTQVTPYGNVVSNPRPRDLASQLERLQALKDKGTLTDAEFQAAKQKLIGMEVQH